MLHKIIFGYANFSVIWSGRFYVLAVDYKRYFIGNLCSDNLDKGKYTYWRN